MKRETPIEMEAASRLRLAVTRLSRRLRQQAPPGATPSMLSALSSIARQGPLPLGKLAALERVQPPTMSRIVESLVAEDLAMRKPVPGDGRSALLEATAAGRALIRQRRKQTDAYLAEKLRALSPSDTRVLLHAAEVIERLLETGE